MCAQKGRLSKNRITGQLKLRSLLSWMGLTEEVNMSAGGREGVGSGREGSESENKSKTNLRSGTQRAATQEGLMRSRGLWNDVASEWGEWPQQSMALKWGETNFTWSTINGGPADGRRWGVTAGGEKDKRHNSLCSKLSAPQRGAAMGNQEWRRRRGENFTHLSVLKRAGLVRKIDA